MSNLLNIVLLVVIGICGCATTYDSSYSDMEQNVLSTMAFDYDGENIYYYSENSNNMFDLIKYDLETGKKKNIRSSYVPAKFDVTEEGVYYIDLLEQYSSVYNMVYTNEPEKNIYTSDIRGYDYAYFQKYKNYCYYLNNNDLVRINEHGFEKLNSGITSLTITDDKLYFIKDDMKICSANLDGSNEMIIMDSNNIPRPKSNSKVDYYFGEYCYIDKISICNDKIYFILKRSVAESHGLLYECNLKGDNIQNIINVKVQNYQIHNDKIYFIGQYLNDGLIQNSSAVVIYSTKNKKFEMLADNATDFCIASNKIFIKEFNYDEYTNIFYYIDLVTQENVLIDGQK